MAVLLGLVLLVTVSANSPSLQEFRTHSNGNAEYRFVESVECPSGLRQSGYSFAPAGRVVLKQVNHDGTVGPVCIKED